VASAGGQGLEAAGGAENSLPRACGGIEVELLKGLDLSNPHMYMLGEGVGVWPLKNFEGSRIKRF
jgi:hypothetical protein